MVNSDRIYLFIQIKIVFSNKELKDSHNSVRITGAWHFDSWTVSSCSKDVHYEFKYK